VRPIAEVDQTRCLVSLDDPGELGKRGVKQMAILVEEEEFDAVSTAKPRAAGKKLARPKEWVRRCPGWRWLIWGFLRLDPGRSAKRISGPSAREVDELIDFALFGWSLFVLLRMKVPAGQACPEPAPPAKSNCLVVCGAIDGWRRCRDSIGSTNRIIGRSHGMIGRFARCCEQGLLSISDMLVGESWSAQ
jgi:hypothetical protein